MRTLVAAHVTGMLREICVQSVNLESSMRIDQILVEWTIKSGVDKVTELEDQ